MAVDWESFQARTKKARSLSVWELAKDDRPGLSDLFGESSSTRRLSAIDNSDSFLADAFFTLRLEHRVGGNVSQWVDEERFLLFRSDRAGAIGKIVFSTSQNKSKGRPEAKIHVLDVKQSYRGKGLGTLIFNHAIDAVKEQYGEIECCLDAEEEAQRHDRLLAFYQQLGCQIRPNAKIQYLNNNDGETYRKVPMKIQLSHSTRPRRKSMLGTSFLPIKLLEISGQRAEIGCQRQQLDWLVIDNEDGRIQFRTTEETYLSAGEGKDCTTVDEEDDSCFFHLYRVCDDDVCDDSEHARGARRMQLWMLQSSTGSFLTTDCHSLSCSKLPSFWQADDQKLSLTCTTDTPPRRNHYRQSWATQTTAYVREMRLHYMKFESASMTLRQALDLTQKLPCNAYCIHKNGPSLRTLCFRAAEHARSTKQPDWVQLIALTHELSRVVTRIESGTHTGHNWTIASRSRVVGCAAPDRASFGEYRYHNADEAENMSPQGVYDRHCGLHNVLLAWTGPEYMYHMLKHNDALIPDEGMAMLRFFTLGDWHAYGEYDHLANQDDEVVKPFVAEFDTLRRNARDNCDVEMSQGECDALWDSHYSHVASKYGIDRLLQW